MSTARATARRRGRRRSPTPRTTVSVLGQRLLPQAERRRVLQAVRRVLRAANLGAVQVGVVFVNDLEMRALNRAWRKQDRPTDVLSFAAQEGEPMAGTDGVLGDLVISVDTARRQARALGHALHVEVAVLCAHGACHLSGLDHERSPSEAKRQLQVEHSILGAAGVEVSAALTARGAGTS